ncbi:neurotrophin 1 [Vespula pensylvanica]|uniref:neurotrophin 1 n=1 Tax=Vespula pensylvanica TaxID=30213 RepID=UPI001CB9F11F|nr:neurotrophin 1 [Vespula pensylvanica]
MTKRETNSFGRIFVSGYIVLLFFKNVHTYPRGEFEFSEPSVDRNWESNNNDSTQHAVHTKIITFDRKDQSSISTTNQMYDQDRSIRGTQIGQRRLLEQRNNIDGKFIFPTEDTLTSESHKATLLSPAPVCNGTTFCERVFEYPEEIINAAIQQNNSIKYLATVDAIPDVVQRIDATDDAPLCLSTEQVIYPKSAETKNKEWLFVINQENFKQGVRIETCSNENSECNIINGLAEGYKTTCKQKYIYRQLAAVSNNGKINPEMFRFPSSCCCHVKFIGNSLTRMGIIGDQRNQKTEIKNRKK